MAAAIDLRSDFDGDGLRRLARASRDGRQVRRLLALAAIYDGGTRSEAARIGGLGLSDRARLGGAVQRSRPGGPD